MSAPVDSRTSKLALRKRRGVASRVLGLFCVGAAILCFDTYLVHHYAATQPLYDSLIELAEQQRASSSRMSLLVEIHSDDDRPAHEVLLEPAKNFDNNLGFLEAGARGSIDPSEIPEGISNALRIQRREWNRVRPFLLGRAERGPARPLLSRDELESSVTRLSKSSMDVFEAVQKWRHEEGLKLAHWVYAAGLAGLLTLLAALRLAWDQVVAPMKRLRDLVLSTTSRIAATMPHNEIDAVTRGVTEMSSALSELRQERSKITADLRRAETDYESIFNNAVAGILRSDVNGRPLLANRALARMLGYSTAEELLEAVSDVHAQLFADDNHRERFEELCRKHDSVELETKALRRDGTTVSVLESGRSTDTADGLCVYDIVIVDVTPLKKAQELLRALSGELLRSQDCERRRIARELHDSTGQLLATLEMKLGTLDRLLPELRECVESSVALSGECSRQLRSMSYLLHPPMLEEMGLVYALQTFVKGFSERSGIHVELDAPSDLSRIDSDAELALFRVAQEGLTNVQRHAGSPDAIIRVRSTENTVRLEVEDHGRGLDEDLLGTNGNTTAKMGVGIRGMEERLRQFKGQLSIQSDRGRTVLGAVLPLSPSAPSDGARRRHG